MNGSQAAWLPDSRRLHLNHGPIDLIIEAFGRAEEVQRAYAQAVKRFETVLNELVEELAELRRPAAARPRLFAGRPHGAGGLPSFPGLHHAHGSRGRLSR